MHPIYEHNYLHYSLNMKEQERLLALMQSEGLNSKEFAQQVGISAATMSNVINGRNNPSLEVMQKVLNRFRNVSTNWLILGVGSMYLEKSNSQDDKSSPNSLQEPESPGVNVHSLISGQYAESAHPASQTPTLSPKPANNLRQVTRVLVFYNDGTFEELHK